MTALNYFVMAIQSRTNCIENVARYKTRCCTIKNGMHAVHEARDHMTALNLLKHTYIAKITCFIAGVLGWTLCMCILYTESPSEYTPAIK